MKHMLRLALAALILGSLSSRACPVNIPGPADGEQDSIRQVKTRQYTATTKGLSYQAIETYFDSSYMPRSLYFNIRFAAVSGLSAAEVINGQLDVQVLDQANKPMPPVKAPKWYCAKTTKDRDEVNILLSIPLNPADGNNRKYSYRLSLQTSKGIRIIVMEGKLMK